MTGNDQDETGHAPPLANVSQGPASSHWSLGELPISIHIQNTHLRPSNPTSCLPFRHTQLSSSHLPAFISSLALSHSLRRWPPKYPNILNPTTQSSAKHFHSTNKVRRPNLQRRRLCVPGSRLSVSCLMSGQACFFHECVRRHDVADGPSSLAPSPAGALTSPKLPSLLLPPVYKSDLHASGLAGLTTHADDGIFVERPATKGTVFGAGGFTTLSSTSPPRRLTHRHA
ncbi:hypothetical protein K456DRAFT_55614 [Colletotrichum gloeosporioides 23]|nr:hypothetical protein K456DRAFT_55614 [Colletotrichum gloeosporioides 23]